MGHNDLISEVAHQLGYEFGGIAHLAEGLYVGQTMIAVIGGTETRELFGVSHPVEVATVYYYTAYL